MVSKLLASKTFLVDVFLGDWTSSAEEEFGRRGGCGAIVVVGGGVGFNFAAL